MLHACRYSSAATNTRKGGIPLQHRSSCHVQQTTDVNDQTTQTLDYILFWKLLGDIRFLFWNSKKTERVIFRGFDEDFVASPIFIKNCDNSINTTVKFISDFFMSIYLSLSFVMRYAVTCLRV